MPHRSRKVKLFFASIKLLLAVAILGFLIVRIQSHSGFERLLSQPKNWLLLLLAQGLILAGFSLSFVRWYLLIRGLGLPFHLRDAFRLGSLGYMLNQVSPGSVGGDLLKAVFIAKEHPEQKTEAVATVLLDRVIGLYAISLVASVGLMLLGQSTEPNTILNTMRIIVWSAAAAGTVGLLLAMSPAATAIVGFLACPSAGRSCARCRPYFAPTTRHRGRLSKSPPIPGRSTGPCPGHSQSDPCRVLVHLPRSASLQSYVGRECLDRPPRAGNQRHSAHTRWTGNSRSRF